MKYLRIFLLACVLHSCAKAPPPATTTAVSKSSAEVLALFDDTTAQKEERLLSLSATALRAGIPLDSARAERCWREEAARPVLRETCVLLWSGRGDSSALLEEALTSGRSRILALALLQRRALLGRIPLSGLFALLDSLATDALWVRAEITLAWLELHGSPGITEGEALLTRIRPGANEGPRDLASSLNAIRRIRAGAWREALGAYCDPATRGEARLRCWRLAGALASPSIAPELRSFLPDSNDDDWILFFRAFPRLARKLQASSR